MKKLTGKQIKENFLREFTTRFPIGLRTLKVRNEETTENTFKFETTRFLGKEEYTFIISECNEYEVEEERYQLNMYHKNMLVGHLTDLINNQSPSNLSDTVWFLSHERRVAK